MGENGNCKKTVSQFVNTIKVTPITDRSQSANKSAGTLKKNQPPSCGENLFNYFSQYCGASGVHGVQYLGEPRRYLAEKIFWAITITIVWCVCMILIFKTYNKWAASPVIVTFATTETPISTIPFPAVTICPVVKTDSNIFNFTDVLLKKFQGKNITTDEEEKFEIFSLVCSGIEGYLKKDGFLEIKNQTVNENLFDYLLEAFPEIDADNTEVRWLGKSIDLGNLSLSVTSDGLCYCFNMLHHSEILRNAKEFTVSHSGEGTKSQKWSLDNGYPEGSTEDAFPRRSFLSGIDGGFQMILSTNRTHLDFLCGEMLQGFKVTLHHPCEMPNMNQHFRVPLDQAVLVAIKPRLTLISEELKSYKVEDRKCYLTDERTLLLFQIYTQENCLDECFSNYTLLQCGCVPFYIPDIGSSPICGSGKNLDESAVNYLANSTCNCLPSCTSLEYDVEISQTDWDWRKMYGVLEIINPDTKKIYDYDNIHLSMVSVYYKEMQFLSSERHELYGYVDLFSSTGGLLGLFIGFSVTSAIEILYFLTLRLGCNIRRFGRLYWSGDSALINAEDNQ